jgi:hypothetical protein
MRLHIDGGLAASRGRGARLALAVGEGANETASCHRRSAQSELAAALDAFDEPSAQAVIDRLLATTTLDASSPRSCCRTCGSSATAGSAGRRRLAQEHFASSILRGRLLGLARGWGLGLGPLALLACLPA